MNDHDALDHTQRTTLERITGHPTPRDLRWREVHALLDALGSVSSESGGRHRVTFGGHTEVIRPPAHGDLPVDLVVKLRHLLTADPVAVPPEDPRELVVVVDHRGAEVYEVESGQEVERVRPYDPRGRLRHLHHARSSYDGQRTPEEPAFYRELVRAVRGARSVVVLGHADGHSDAAGEFDLYLRDELGPVAPEVVRAQVDTASLTEAELLDTARAVFEEQLSGRAGVHPERAGE